MDTIKNNTLVQYQGGGYDGCFWEWNFFYISKDGTFMDIHSTGRNGCKSLNDWIAKKPQTYVYDMGDKKACEYFGAESNAGLVHAVAKWFQKNGIVTEDILVACNYCKKKLPAEDMKPDGLQGCGGTALQYTEFICESCDGQRCSSCDSVDHDLHYVSTYRIFKDGHREHYDQLCQNCFDALKEDAIERMRGEEKYADAVACYDALQKTDRLTIPYFNEMATKLTKKRFAELKKKTKLHIQKMQNIVDETVTNFLEKNGI